VSGRSPGACSGALRIARWNLIGFEFDPNYQRTLSSIDLMLTIAHPLHLHGDSALQAINMG
jgi:hypothetical protein